MAVTPQNMAKQENPMASKLWALTEPKTSTSTTTMKGGEGGFLDTLAPILAMLYFSGSMGKMFGGPGTTELGMTALPPPMNMFGNMGGGLFGNIAQAPAAMGGSMGSLTPTMILQILSGMNPLGIR